MIEDISVVIIARDAQRHIDASLKSLQSFSEVILYLNNSSDNTENLASSYQNVTIIQGEFIGFGPTKNVAATYASNDWILSLDSDEVITDKLLEEIESLKLDNCRSVFKIKRDNFFLGKIVKHSGWGSDFLIRIYNKKYHAFNQNIVHEQIQTIAQSQIITLKNSFHHYAVDDINQFLYKAIKYSDLAAKDKQTQFFSVVILESFAAFFKAYILKLGFLDGWRGFVIAISNFNGKFFRYSKRYINYLSSKDNL